MSSWRENMPKGMFLKSEVCASDLFEPTEGFTMRRYAAEEGLSDVQDGAPLSLKAFTQYGRAFQRRFVPMVEETMVDELDRSSGVFILRLSSGESLTAAKVVVATGISHAAHVPDVLSKLPPELVSHSSNHYDLSGFAGRSVAVIGGGQSAIETATLLHASGVDVRLIARRPELNWNATPQAGPRPLYQRIRHPMSKLGPGLGVWIYSNAPNLYCRLPQSVRLARVRKALGPAGAWWLRKRVEGRVAVDVGHSLRNAEVAGQKVRLDLQTADGEVRQFTADHVIAATGFRFALSALPFLAEGLLERLRTVKQTPVLSANFESSVKGLYFTGLSSANQFGPVMRFLHGAGFTARRTSRHIAKSLTRSGRRVFAELSH